MENEVSEQTTTSSANPPSIEGHSDQYISVTVHETTFNNLFKAMKSIHVKHLGFTIKISEMEATLVPSQFQFKAFAEVLGVLNAIPQLKQTVHGECDLTLDAATGRLLLNIRKLMVELPKICGFGGGLIDVAGYITSIPLKGLINLTHPIDLPKTCEAGRIQVIARDQKFIVEEKRATFSVQIEFQEATSNE